jgi:asparagine synthase (glutamine-hydrolysing)
MCGIAAVLGEKGANTLEKARAAIAILHHRGPDRSTVWQSNDGRVTLAHARLSTIDLLSGPQLNTNEDATVIAVVNGEFYGFEETRTHLETLGHTFRTRTDSEILIHLYERHGTSCVDHLEGEFAFVLWDEREQTLFAARDRFGAKPLYYSQNKNELLFASEIKGLQQAGVTLAWNHQGLLEKLILQTSLAGRTVFQGVQELPAGHYLLYKNGTSAVRQYWDLCYPLEENLPPPQSDDSYAETLLALLDQAVHTRMKSDVPVGCYLSGGIDSNSVLGLMNRHATQPVPAFCLSFDDPSLDEFDQAALSASRMGSPLTKVSVTSQSLAADFVQTIWHCETLIENANCVARFSLSRAVRDAGYRVVLTGDGSDEVFAGYPIFVIDSLRHGTATEMQELKQALGLTDEALRQLLNPAALTASPTLLSRLGYLPAWLEGRHHLCKELAPICHPAFRQHDIDALLLNSLQVRNQLNGRSIINQSLYLHAKTSLPGVTLSSLSDRVEMAHSVESRLPFLDRRVVDFARTLPRSQKINKGAEKFVLRKAMRSVVPPEICGRRKRPLSAPLGLTDGRSPFAQLLEDILRSRYLENIPFVDAKATRQLLDRRPSMDPLPRQRLEAPLMSLASACVLSEKFSL